LNKKGKVIPLSKFKNERDIDKNDGSGCFVVRSTVMVQIAKEPISTKGPGGSEISIAGRTCFNPFRKKFLFRKKLYQLITKKHDLKKLIQFFAKQKLFPKKGLKQGAAAIESRNPAGPFGRLRFFAIWTSLSDLTTKHSGIRPFFIDIRSFWTLKAELLPFLFKAVFRYLFNDCTWGPRSSNAGMHLSHTTSTKLLR